MTNLDAAIERAKDYAREYGDVQFVLQLAEEDGALVDKHIVLTRSMFMPDYLGHCLVAAAVLVGKDGELQTLRHCKE
jgi:hypothetical protein